MILVQDIVLIETDAAQDLRHKAEKGNAYLYIRGSALHFCQGMTKPMNSSCPVHKLVRFF